MQAIKRTEEINELIGMIIEAEQKWTYERKTKIMILKDVLLRMEKKYDDRIKIKKEKLMSEYIDNDFVDLDWWRAKVLDKSIKSITKLEYEKTEELEKIRTMVQECEEEKYYPSKEMERKMKRLTKLREQEAEDSDND